MPFISSLLKSTGPERSCSSKMPIHGKWFSSKPWKLLTLVGAKNVQLCLVLVEKRHYTEIRDQKHFVTSCLGLWKVCMRFACCTQRQRSRLHRAFGFRGRHRLLGSKAWSVLVESNRAEALGRRLLPAEGIHSVRKINLTAARTRFRNAEQSRAISTWRQLG